MGAALLLLEGGYLSALGQLYYTLQWLVTDYLLEYPAIGTETMFMLFSLNIGVGIIKQMPKVIINITRQEMHIDSN